MKYSDFNENFLKAKNGDIKSKETLILGLRPLIISSINKYYRNYSEFEDLIQDSYVLALEILENVEITTGKHFLGYFRNGLRFKLLDKHKEIKEITILNSTNNENQEFIDTLLDESTNIEKDYIDIELRKEIWNNFEKLSEREVEIIFRYYIQNQSISEIAKKLEIAYRTVVNIKGNGINKLRKKLLK